MGLPHGSSNQSTRESAASVSGAGLAILEPAVVAAGDMLADSQVVLPSAYLAGSDARPMSVTQSLMEQGWQTQPT